MKTAGEEELGKELLAWWKKLVDFEIESFKSLLPVGWHAVDLIEYATERKWSWAEIVKQDGASEGLWKVPTTGEIGKMDAENRRHYYKILKRWMDSLDDPESVLGNVMDRHWFRPWWQGYEVLERRIVELETFTERLEADPQELVRFVMDGYAPLV